MLIFVLALQLMLAPQLFEPDPRSLKTEVSEVEFLQIWVLDDFPELLAIAFAYVWFSWYLSLMSASSVLSICYRSI
jgi:hypothetical protein